MSFAAPLRLREQRRILLPFAICTLVWGSTWLVIGSQIRFAPAAWSIAYRFALGAIGMAMLCRLTGVSLRLPAPAHRLALLIGLPQFALNYLGVYAAEAHIASGLVALLSALLLVPNALLGWLWLGQKISRRFFLGSTIAVAGIALLFADQLHRAPAGGHDYALGILLSLAAVLAASFANILQTTKAARLHPSAALLTWAMAYGALADAAVALATSGAPVLPLAPTYLAGLVYLAFAGSVLTFSLYFGMIRRIGPARAGYVAVLIPVIAMTLSTLYEGYRWTPGAVGGCLLALAGLVVATRARSPA